MYRIYIRYMPATLITLKLNRNFLKEVDTTVKKQGYHNRTEFIRAALREKMEQAQLQQIKKEIWKLKGASKRKITDEEYERARREAFEEFYQELK